ncbi:MAG: DUF1569 domain-containing protein [Gemmatimonadota bacterium]
MKHLYDSARVSELQDRLARMTAEQTREWGTMTLPQALAHCSLGFDVALGVTNPPRMMMGRLFGGLIKRLALGDDSPFRRNTPTVPSMVVADEHEFTFERDRLRALIDRFAAAGPGGCTTHPHAFFGKLTPVEWATIMYKHVDHHLRQFGG